MTELDVSPRAARARRALWWALGLTFALYVVPFGRLLLYPLMLFGTFVHEMGHGITAILVGGDFTRFRMWANGSGMASTRGVGEGLASALVSAGGLIGPTLLGAVLFFVARRAKRSRYALGALAIALVLADVIWVRNAFGVVYVALVAAALAWVVWRFTAEGAQVALVFVAMQLCLSVFSDIDYMFSRVAKTSGGTIPSDTAAMAAELGGFFWMWGALTAAFAIGAALIGIEQFLRATRSDG
jgi:hypothetical protein